MHVSNVKIEDRLLLKRAACQECSESLAIIYCKYKPVICDYLTRADAGDMVEDICHTLFLRLFIGKYNYDCQTNVDAYLCLVAKNILRNHRRIKTEILYPPKQIESLNAEAAIIIQQDTLEKVEEHERLERLIADLPTKSRKAIKLEFTGVGKGGAAIAERFDNQDAFRMRLRYAIKLLREKNKKL